MQFDSFILDGRYVLETEIGRGGMGVVFKARDQLKHSYVAVKALDFTNIPDKDKQDVQERFEREARMSIALNHPQIVKVLDFICINQRSFLIMELLEGHTLKTHLQDPDKQLTPGELLQVFIQWCDGLHYAHQQGIIHRDIKPDNLFITTDKQAKIMDFGVARQNNAEEFLRQTVPGMMMGTLNYMSPEQLQDTSSVDQRTDIFSMGIVLYETYTGHLPFHSESMGKTIMNILSEEPIIPQIHAPEMSNKLADIILKAMTKRRGQRYQSAQELGKELLLLMPEELPQSSTAQSQEAARTGQHWQRQTLQQHLGGQNPMTQPALGSIKDHLTPEELQSVGASKTLFDRDTGLKLECEPHGLSAWLSHEPTMGMEAITLEAVQRLISRADIQFGILQDNITQLITEPMAVDKILLAQGQEPIEGSHAYVEYLLPQPLPGPQAQRDGSVDHRMLNKFQSVVKNTPLMRKHPLQEGQAGMSIYGKAIESQKVRDIKLLEGPGTRIESDAPDLLLADIDGMPTPLSQSVRVDDVLELQEVGPDTGHIQFDGSIVIHGNVQKGYQVKGGGDVVVYGTVENAQIFSEGNIYLHGSVYGGPNTELKSKYHLHAHFIQNADIECGGDMIITEGLFHCRSYVGGKAQIGIKSGRGIVNGGELYSSHNLEINQAGTISGTQTYLCLGRHPRYEMYLQDLKSTQALLKQQLQNNIKNIIYQRTQGLQPERMKILEEERTELIFKNNTLTDEILFLESQLEATESPLNSEIQIKSSVMPGVKVNISGKSREFLGEKSGPLRLKLKSMSPKETEVGLEYV